MTLPLVTSDLVLCLQADAFGTLDDSSIVTTWVDQCGAGNNGVVHGNPLFRTARTPLGSPSIQFTGGSGPYYTLSSNTIFDAASAAEVFLVLTSAATDNVGPIHFGGPGSFYPHPSGPGGNSVYDGSFTHSSDPRANFAAPAPVSSNAWHIYNISHDGTDKTFRVNNGIEFVQTVGFTTPGASGATTLELGFYTGADHKYSGEFAEILAYTRALDPTERDDVYAYLVGRHFDDGSIRVAVPSATFTFYTPPPADPLPHVVVAPPADVVLDAPAATLVTATVTLTGPADDVLLPSLRPRFTVTVVSTEPSLTVQVQVDTDPDFGDPLTLSTPAPTGQPVLAVSTAATTDLTDDTAYRWRARAVNLFAGTDWTPTRGFTTGSGEGDALASGTWTVSAGTTAVAHLWFARPPRGTSGDTITVYGTGFGPTTVTATIAGIPATVTDWDTVAPTADAYTTDRVIDADTGQVSPTHQVATLTVPDGAHPGGALILDGS
jgi:hypothetical protein